MERLGDSANPGSSHAGERATQRTSTRTSLSPRLTSGFTAGHDHGSCAADIRPAPVAGPGPQVSGPDRPAGIGGRNDSESAPRTVGRRQSAVRLGSAKEAGAPRTRVAELRAIFSVEIGDGRP